MKLLERWNDIYTEATRLCKEIEQLPEDCACGDGAAHLDARCECCRGHLGKPGEPLAAQRCTELLATIRADLALFCADFGGLADADAGMRTGEVPRDIRRGVVMAATDLTCLAEAFARTDEAVAGFMKNCTLAQMRQVKRHAVTLREHFDSLQRALIREQS